MSGADGIAAVLCVFGPSKNVCTGALCPNRIRTYVECKSDVATKTGIERQATIAGEVRGHCPPR
jgi:hypothetical protein